MNKYTEIKKGMEYELFEKTTNDSVFATIQQEVDKFLTQIKEKGENPKPAILGAFVLNDVPLKAGGKTNLWIEYNCYLIPIGGMMGMDVGIHRAIMFDEIPDIVLDRYNEVEKFIYETNSQTHTCG